VQIGPTANVLGNESRITDSERAKAGGQGRQKAPATGAQPEVALDKADVMRGLQDANRESEAVQGETGFEQYRDIVEKYFRAISR
jgi:predicted metal-dependent TIM-barrel fold hydrolase